MQASTTEPPATPPPAEPPPPAARSEKPGVGWRVLAVIAGLLWGLMGVALIVVGLEILDAPLREDAQPGEDYYDGSSTQKFFDLLFGFPAGVLGVATALLAIYFAATARRGRLLVQIAVAALVLFVLTLLVGGL